MGIQTANLFLLNKFRELLNNGTLIIRNTTSVDDGFYQCSIYVYKENESPWIFLSRRAKIISDEIDHFEYQPTDTKVNLGEFAAFRCMVVRLR